MSKLSRALLVCSLGTLFQLPHIQAQAAGEVLWHQKISAAQGGGPRNIHTNDQFGRAAAALGDVDGDGVCDLAVGALGDDDGIADDSLNYGACWILFMNTDGTVRDDYKISRTSAGLPLDPGDEWGRAVRELGDWDLDGIPDVMVGACYDDDNGTDKGAFYLLFLNRDGSVKKWKKISETEGGFTGDLDPDDQFGRGIRLLGDLDLDGVPEIGVGSIRDDDGGRNRGAYWILFMNRDGTVRTHTKLSETAGGFTSSLSDRGEFGFDACLIGDRDGDGVQDIIVSAPDEKTDGDQQGALFVLHLNRDGTVKSDFRIAENYAGFDGDMLEYNDEFGCAVDTVGDLDGDGNVDIAVGVGKDDDGPSGAFDRGAVYILLLNSDATVKSWQKISRTAGRFYEPLDDADRFGTSLACPGDLNGDGIVDLFVGARFDDDGGSAAGAEYFLALNDGTLVPPDAGFAHAPRRGRAPHEVVFTDHSTGDVTSWEWDFGDGTTSTEQHPRHTYIGTGVKSVSLIAKGPAGSDQRYARNIIKVDPPVLPLASFQASPTLGMGPLDVGFTDSSTGLITTWAWDFGDGSTSTEREPNHVYELVGTYDVTLTVGNESGTDASTRAAYVVVTDVPPPVADFTFDTPEGVSPLAVQFQDASLGDVSARSWDFGDGTSSEDPAPRHVYLLSGTFSVSLTVSGPGGADTETKTELITVSLPPMPVAEFAADPLSGIDPLTVNFTDLTSGLVTGWDWNFGDGQVATAQHPTHTYAVPGLYTVSLAATGPGGTGEITKVDLVSVFSVRRGLLDTSFEEQTPATPPGGAWSVFAGSEHRVEPGAESLTDGPFPTEGSQWLRISSAGTSFTSPPSNPGGETAPAIGGAGVEQHFYLADPFSRLEFDASFVRGGPARNDLDNDWMSVDVSDGATVVNLFYADTHTPTPKVSSALRMPKTPVQHVAAQLRTLFPSSNRNTRFTLTIQVGNGAADSRFSYGLVDGFLLEQAHGTALRYGCDPATRGSLTILEGEPRVGTTLVLGVDNPLGTQGPNSRSFLWMSLKPDALFPCGTAFPNLGMSGPGASGEILVDRDAGGLLKTITGGLWSESGTPAQVPVAMPGSIAWIGRPLYVQGYLIDPRNTYGVRVAVTDALKLLVGP